MINMGVGGGFTLNKLKYLKISVTLLYLRYKYAIMFDEEEDSPC